MLLKNADGVLPLARSPGSVAIIGVDAGTQAVTAGKGSAYVEAPFLITPLQALRKAFGKGTRISFAPGDPPGLLAPIPTGDFVSGVPLPPETATGKTQEHGNDPAIDHVRNLTPTPAVATSPWTGHGESLWSWSAVIRVPSSGLYEFSLQRGGETWLGVNGHTVLASPGLNARPGWSTTVALQADRPYSLEARWYSVNGRPLPQLGFEDVSPLIAPAVRVARASRVALVFAGELQGEGTDRPSLDLPGYANALIAAVAAANPRTVVVLNTGGAVLMPWLADVRAVLEAWYPGEEDGAAVTALLLGRVDPSGRLPLSFPATEAIARAASGDGFPGVNGTVRYTSGLDIGYRWYEAHDVRPLFPFGYGLSYTSFTLSGASLRWTGEDELARLTVTDTGNRSGTDVVEAYVRFPAGAGEPPRQLAGFETVALAPGGSRLVTLVLPLQAFQAFLGGRFRTVPGQYLVGFGQSSADVRLWLATRVPPASSKSSEWEVLAIVLASIAVLGLGGLGLRLRVKTA